MVPRDEQVHPFNTFHPLFGIVVLTKSTIKKIYIFLVYFESPLQSILKSLAPAAIESGTDVHLVLRRTIQQGQGLAVCKNRIYITISDNNLPGIISLWQPLCTVYVQKIVKYKMKIKRLFFLMQPFLKNTTTWKGLERQRKIISSIKSSGNLCVEERSHFRKLFKSGPDGFEVLQKNIAEQSLSPVGAIKRSFSSDGTMKKTPSSKTNKRRLRN